MTRQRGTLNGGWNGSQEANDGVSVANMATTDAINILDAVEVPVVVLRRDFTISYFNKAGADMFGLSPSDIGRASRDISVLDALPLLKEHCSHVINGEVESRVDFRDGNKWFVVRISPNTQGNRPVIGTVLT